MRRDDKFIQEFSRTQGNLPHWEDVGATYFVRCALQRPATIDLTVPSLGQIMVDALLFGDGARYRLYDYTVMPDHLHAILQPAATAGTTERITSVTYTLKQWTAKKINAALGRKGTLWQEESYDHIIRNRDDYEGKALYIFRNSQAAGLVDDPAKWPWWGRGSGCK